MDEYDKKFAEMQKYIPFLEAMIERLQNVKDKSREVQLQKMQSLHGILSNSKRKLKIETLQRCEDVLQKLHNKVEKGNTPGLHFPNKKNDGSSAQSSTGAETAEQSRSKVAQIDDNVHEKKIHETPASPSPPVSPNSGSQVTPIIIPTERSVDFVDDSKPASPDPVDTLPTKAPIIIPTERTNNDITLSPSSQRDPGKSVEDVSFTEWDMLEENENQAARNKNWQSTDVTAAIKLVGSNLSQKISDVRPLGSMHTSRHIPTVSVPSMGGSRRLTTLLEKTRLLTMNLDASPSDRRSESPANVPDARLKSPDPEILFTKQKNSSPRLKESIPRSISKPPAPLLLSPPPVSEPPLSMEDLAELLSEENDGKTEDEERAKKDKQDASKDPRTSKPTALAQKNVDSDSNKRWEEIDKHIVKLTTRKGLLPAPPLPLAAKTDALKPNETKGPPVNLMHNLSTFLLNAEKPVVENRNRPPSPGSKTEPRYADNYERHPRQQRDGHSHDNVKDKSNLIHCRPSDEDIANAIPVHHGGPGIEERNPMIYTRRQGNVPPEIPARIETQEFRMEGTEYFNRQMPNQAPLWPPMHTPVNTNEFAQWPPAANFSGIPNTTPQPYQHPMGMHQEMWNVAAAREPLLMDPAHPINEAHRPNQFPATMATGIRPLISPTARSQDLSHIPRPDEMTTIDGLSMSTIQPMISPTRFPVGPQCRSFQGESRPYEQSFDRNLEYPHQRQSWDAQAARPNEVAYRPENEVPCVVKAAADAARPFSRPSTPCPWTRDRGGGRGRSAYYNERNRAEARSTFNRDARRNDWPRDAHNEWDNSNRFSKDNRNISDRDPRVREHNAASQPAAPPKEASPSVRDPRLARDKHFSPKAKETFSERDPRKRSTGSTFSQTFRKAKEKTKSPPKVSDNHKPENVKQPDKIPKDKMQSPLESLYGVIDTKAKTAQGYNLQKFKIPKIKRNESAESPTSSHTFEELKPPECADKEASKTGKDKEDTVAEVSSSSDGNLILEEEDWNEGGGIVCEKKDEYIFPEPAEEKSEPVVEPDQITTTSPKPSSSVEKKEETEPEGSKPKEEVTQEWIEALIRKSFEFGEGKKFVEQAKFMQKLGEVLQAKKLKKIKKIIESESESSSEKEDTPETKKLRVRKKRRVIVSDSSDDESLAERLGVLSTGSKQTNEESSVQDKTAKVATSIEASTPNESTLDSADVDASKTKVPEEDVQINPPSTSEDLGNPETVDHPETATAEAQDESLEDKDNANKTPKAKAKRRNSLEMLQEDIREMFISNDVVSATGHRQCRAQKEGQPSSAALPSQTTAPAKKEEPSKRVPEATSDTDEPRRPPTPPCEPKKPPKSRPAEKPSKKSKSKKEASRVTRQRTKQVDQSSDSEEDQPLALRTELVQRCNAAEDQDASLDEPERRRRSKRIINKETIKEPRVLVEKADISKFEISKVMFDSSSDESFGIDVSELAAAVDVSLHPDKHSEPETSEPTEKRKASSPKKAKRKPGVELNDIKVEETMLTDEESIISNVSMTSSVASAKKATPLPVKTDISSSEELLSNILVGLTAPKAIKEEPPADKGSDADVDEDVANDQSIETSTKRSLGKKKKKKWQMGILSKKKKRKAAATFPSKDDSDTKSAGKSTADETSLSNTTNESISEQLDDSQTPKKEETSNEKENASKGNRDSGKKSPVKENETLKTVKSKAKVSKSFYNLDINSLASYAWTGQERYKCLLCFFTGKNIVHHYKLNHAGREILISRLNQADAQLAIRDANRNDVENTSLKPLTDETCKFNCRICTFITEGAAKVAMEAFYEHWTTHTGEYRFRCNSCPYQAVAKSSMRTHYYKVCRRFKDTFGEAITEDEIPDENRVYGYLCSGCNYVQLKRSNLEEHVELWHKDDSKAEIIKIDMSLNEVKIEPVNVSVEGTVKVEAPQVDTDNLDESVSDTVASHDDATDVEFVKNTEPVEEEKTKDTESKKNSQPEDGSRKEDSAEVGPKGAKRKKTTEGEGDSSLPTGNLSVFVCPPELEKKEVEIQLERKRKMQEIVQNIGIKIQKDAAKKGLSIIDKLKDKMKTNVEGDENESNATPKSPSRAITNPTGLARTELSSSTPVPVAEDSDTILPVTQETPDDRQSKSPDTYCDNLYTPEAVDPLAIVDQKKNDESDGETSDNDNARSSARIYESDSSSEQSDAELSTDVNMILKETSTINASSKDPMITTIQRLAAKLQATKPIESADDSSVKSGEAADKSDVDLPKPPDVVPINSIKRFVGKLNRFHEIVPENNDDSNPPKNFIRLRRLSGDMLSVSTPPPSTQEEAQTPRNDEPSAPEKMEGAPPADGDEECSFLKIENVVSLAPSAASGTESPIINDIRKAVETSTVKGKGGMSILKKSHSPIILKRLNTVTIAQPITKNIPIQSKPIQSAPPELVKLIPMKTLSPSPVSVAAAQIATNFIPIAPKSKIIQMDNKLSFPLTGKTTVVTPVTTRTVTVGGSTQTSSYKIVKVVRAPILKTKDNPLPSPVAIKLKSMDVYNAMLKPVKLTQLYKCMGRDCPFTTDILEQYHQHYNIHVATSKPYKKGPFDFQKCAYCYMTLKNWSQMRSHLDEKHAHCRYQCSYCFYRAISLSHVQIHQAISHPGLHDVLLGKLVKDVPRREEVDRYDFVHPYICKYAECEQFFYVPESFAAHLKTKHGNLVSSFRCHVCCTTFTNTDQLLTHYKGHGFYKYQCLYCLSGTDTLIEMHNHLSLLHCNRLPQALERSLPLQTQRNKKKDVIDQLIIRTMDDTFKITEVDMVPNDEKTTKDSTPVDPGTTSQQDPKASYSQLPNDVSMLDKDENEALNKSLSSLFGSSSSSSSSAQRESTSPKNSDENVAGKPLATIKTDPDSSMTSALNKESTYKNLSDLQGKVTSFLFDKNPLEPLELPAGTFDCSDEFININLLDNPDFLMNVNSRSSNVSFVSNENESKAEDSDIEIVDIINSYSSSTRDAKSKIDANKKGGPEEKEEKADTRSQETDTKAQSGNDVEHSNVSTESSETSGTSTTKTDKPLTLDDIKHTGLQGTKLYICGYETCDFSAQTPCLLKSHSRECPRGGPDKQLNCPHCHKRFLKIGFLLEHMKVHGLKRFGCALCKVRRTVGYQVMAHMKTKHKVNNCKLVPADPKNPSVDGLFVVQPVYEIGERRGKKRKTAKSVEKEFDKVVMDTEKFSFSPDEIESLPRQAIYNRVVQCAVCPYTTKVRTNIIRHLLLHAKDESVPESGPVNPVPCLDKKERMFDKMVNLASSSHQNGRMGGKHKETPKDNENEFIPKFVPEHKRYVCGVAECNYLTVDEAMLRCHLKALHSEEQYFRCPHCPQPPPGQEGLNIAIDKMAVHLKMHDTRLYKCSHCNHHHYHRHIVERHLTDKHPEKRPFVKVIRELENTENNQSVQEEAEEELPDPDGNHWKCNICEYKCVYKAEMVTHAASAHDEKNQFKCALCSFKTSGKIMFEQHIINKHSNDPSVDFILVYQRIKGVNKRNVDNIDQSGQEEPFDTTPLWRRDMPRIRHIRGILLEEENETSSESPLKASKRKSDVELPAIKPAKIKPGKSGSLDDAKQTKEKHKRSLSCDKASVESENSCEASNVADKTKDKVDEDNDFSDSDFGRFGPYGKPEGNLYVCTLCVQFKSKYKHDMRDHLYRELNYARWHCKDCGYLSVNRNALLKHFTKHHNGERPNHEPLSPDDDIEHWVGTLLTRQTRIIKGLPATKDASSTDTTATASGNSTKTSPAKAYPTGGRKTSRSTSLANKASVSQDSKTPSTDFDVDALDDSSKDNEGLMDMDDFSLNTEESPTGSEKLGRKEFREKPLVCKHCNLTFTRWRGFKLHVLLTHLKRLGFICPYCDRSTNSEALMRQHIRSKHPDSPEKIVENPAAGGPELTDQFWEKEYGVIFPKKKKKRKRKPSEETTDDNDQTEKKCKVCGFFALNLAGLKGHMRVHQPKSKFKCFSCSFATFSKADFWSHWELNHPFTPFKLPDSSSESGTSQSIKKNMDDDYSDDIEEEQVSDSKDDRLLYNCFYCSFNDKSLDVIQDHWNKVHQVSKSSSDYYNVKSNYPFRYREMHPADDSPKAQCSKTEMETPYELYLQQSSSDLQMVDMSDVRQEGWICQWCNELCDSEVKMKNHHSMFHSHLPLNFKKQEENKVPKGYVCPECSFTTTFINVMKNHVSRHINLFKCKYCDKTFGSPALVSSHNVEAHPNLELKIESIYNYEALVESIMTKVKWQKSDMDPSDVSQKDVSAESLQNHAVAKKSTAKSAVRPGQVSGKVKAVARKSTNPYPRHLPQSKTNEEQASSTNSKQFSYYRIPRIPVNLGKLNTYMVVGGHRMKVNCTTLARLINIEPKVMLRDLEVHRRCRET